MHQVVARANSPARAESAPPLAPPPGAISTATTVAGDTSAGYFFDYAPEGRSGRMAWEADADGEWQSGSRGSLLSGRQLPSTVGSSGSDGGAGIQWASTGAPVSPTGGWDPGTPPRSPGGPASPLGQAEGSGSPPRREGSPAVPRLRAGELAKAKRDQLANPERGGRGGNNKPKPAGRAKKRDSRPAHDWLDLPEEEVAKDTVLRRQQPQPRRRGPRQPPRRLAASPLGHSVPNMTRTHWANESSRAITPPISGRSTGSDAGGMSREARIEAEIARVRAETENRAAKLGVRRAVATRRRETLG